MKRFQRNHSSHRVPRGMIVLGSALLIQCLTVSPLQAAAKEKPTDTQISAAVESDLVFDYSVPANDIDVTTTDGIVTLSGEVPNLLGKERANAIAETIRGVRAIVNHITVKPVSRSDGQVRKDVESALLTDPATDSYEVKTSVNDGVVTLTGTVESWQEKQLSGTVAKGVKGVKDVKNNILVSYKRNLPDREIAAVVTETLARDVWVDDLLITPTVKDGKVTLTGIVGSVAEKSRAYSDAWVAGVTSVDDRGVKVRAWAKDSMKKPYKTLLNSDTDIQQAVSDAFLFDPRVNSFNPTIAVDHGVVTLTGTVDNLKAKRAAELDAKNTTGVWRVKNYLKVRSQSQPPDDEIARHVKESLLRDPYVERYEISVAVIDGVVALKGTVDSYYEKAHAEDVTSRVSGVTGVNNNLLVSFPTYSYYFWPYSWSYYEPYYDRPDVDSVWPYASDAEIKADIEDELFWSPFVDSDEVKVSVNNGVATLTGTVDSRIEDNAATEKAWEGGAGGIVNKLVVK